jgi:membrane protease YdiL (CAAX protease family)
VNTRAFLERHSVPIYFALAFAISWCGMLLMIGGPGGLTTTSAQLERLMPVVWLAFALGPSVAALFLTAFVSRGDGLRALLSPLRVWRVGARWYAVALFTAPLIAAVLFSALSFRSARFIPVVVTTNARVTLLMLAMAAGLAGAFLEELGWTGFAIPRLRVRYGVLATGLIVGVVWGAWHFLANYWWSGSHSGRLSRASFLPAYFLTGVAQLTAYRTLMVWVYDRTRSLLIATLMHASLIVSTVALVPETSGADFLTWFVIFTAVLWMIVAVVIVTGVAEPYSKETK